MFYENSNFELFDKKLPSRRPTVKGPIQERPNYSKKK